MRLPRPVVLSLLLGAALAGAVALAPQVQGTPPAKPAPSPAATPTGDWKAIEALVAEQKLEAALVLVEARLTAARGTAAEAEWTRALVRTVQLRIGLHGYETAVRFLKDEAWPKGALARATLGLFYGHTLVAYRQAYGWEIGKRERVDSKGPVDLKAWTADQIFEEARRAYEEVWRERAAIGETPVGELGEYLTANNYPARIRGTLRDAVSYLFIELLADTSLWRPAQSNELHRLDLATLLADPAAAPALAGHPLQQLAQLLGDLEAWHLAAGRREAAHEARLERLRRLHASLTESDDRARIRQDLETRQRGLRDAEWWAMGQAELARMVQEEDAGDSLVRARSIAEEGRRAYPESLGGQACLERVKSIEAPEFQVVGMALDAPQRRSLQVTHKNLPALFFRAYPVELQKAVEGAKDYNLLPSYRELEQIVRGRKPLAEWRVDLPATSDYRTHRTFATPPLTQPGLYVIAASARADFAREANRLQAVNLIVGDLVLVRRAAPGAIEVTAVSGESGKPVAGASVSLYRMDWQKGHQRLATETTPADGTVRFAWQPNRQNGPYFVLAQHGADISLDGAGGFWLGAPTTPTERTASLLYTDRSVYRPLQKLAWKVVAYRGGGAAARFHTLPATSVTVSLRDPNGENVESRSLATNDFGSAAGEFTIPAGRMLGAWSLVSSLGGSTPVRVEEYKRPTFEATMQDPESPLRLNRPATLRGEARYYFGLPVASAAVAWRVTREAVYPWWWGWYWHPAPVRGGETVAAGTTTLDPDGAFRFTFTPQVDERLAREKAVTYRYAVTVDVTDEGGETRTAARAFRLGFVAVEARLESDTSFFRAGIRGALTAHRSDLDGVPRAGKAAWTLHALAQPERTLLPADQPLPAPAAGSGEAAEFRTPGDRLRPRWDTDYRPEAILRGWPDGAEAGHGSLVHDAKGEAQLELPRLAAGAYRLRYTTSDDFGARYETQKEFVVAAGDASIALPFLLLAEAASVPVGGVARFLALSGLPDQTLTFDIHRDAQRVERRSLPSGASVIEIPVTEENRGGFGVTLTAVRDHQVMTASHSVFVPWDDRELTLEFASFRDRIRPGAQETWRVTVRQAGGARPVEVGSAELLAYMYDRSLDVFAPHTPASPRGLYPNRSGVIGVASNLGMSHPQWMEDNGFAPVPSGPSLTGDALRFEDGYGVGGPGRRGGVMGGMQEGPRRMRSAPAPPPAAPMMQAAAIPEERSDLALKKENAFADTTLAAEAPAAPAPVLRSNFSETAFWRPQLRTDADGAAGIEFTVPDSVTAWNVWVHALTRDLRSGSLHRETKSVKDLMVRPYLPRFLREGDRAELKVVVNNASDAALSGRVRFDIIDPDTEQSLLAEFGVTDSDLAFSVAKGGGADLTFPITAPRRVGQVAFKVTATAGAFSDGELRPLPLLPSRMHLSQSRFVALKDTARREIRFADLAADDDPSRISEQMVVTLDGQLFYSVLGALPYLVDYPYECTEQTLNRFLSTGILTSLFKDYPAVARMAQELSKRESRLETWDSVDPNRKMALEETPWLRESRGGADPGAPLSKVLDPRIAKAQREGALAKLKKSQTSLGAFPWWSGGPPSPYMTLYIVHGFARALEFGVEVPKDVTVKAWDYLHRHYLDEAARLMVRDDVGWEFVTFLNYVLSSYPDTSWSGGVWTDAERTSMLDFSFRHWKQHSPYLKGYLALTLQRAGRRADARLVWDSVMDSAKTDPDLGTSWAPEDRAWLWYNDTIETHAFALRTLSELAPKDPRRDGIVLWLFVNKQLNHWKSTRATAEVLYSLAHYLKQEGALGVREQATVSVGAERTEFVFEPDQFTGKHNQVVVPGAAIDPQAPVVVEKQGKGLMFASATWHFSTDRLPSEDRGDLLGVSRHYFKRENKGEGFTLTPLAEGAALRLGDEVEVQLSVRARHAAEYVHLRDPRAAGMEPADQVSRYKWDLGIAWYEETRDSGTNFFFEQLPAGEYTLRYRLRASVTGTFRVGPATLQSMYAPEFSAYSAGAVMEVAK